MDDFEEFTHPKKKVKMNPTNLDGTDDSSLPLPQESSSFQVQGSGKASTMDDSSNSDSQKTQATREVEVGISEYVSPNVLGFVGIFKKRYSDFIVNEILPSGEVVHLTDTRAPKLKVSFYHGVEEGISQPSSTKAHDSTSYSTLEVQSELSGTEPEVQSSHADTGEQNGQAQEDKPTSLAKDRDVLASDTGKAALAKWQDSTDKAEVKTTAEDRTELQRFFDQETIEAVIQLFNKVINSPHRSRAQYGQVHTSKIADRELRKDAHAAIRRIFRLRLESSTDGSGIITIYAADPRNLDQYGNGPARYPNQGNSNRGRGGRNQNRGRGRQFGNGWQNAAPRRSQHEIFKELGGDYLHFTLYKENKDTLEVITYLARSLNIKPHAFQFAGNKDRRAITSQRISVHRVFPAKVASANKFLRNARAGNFQFEKNNLSLGDLQGNAFQICLRECEFEGSKTMTSEACFADLEERVRLGMNNLSTRGFINYFGLQRFGSFATRTDIVGMKLLQGDLEGAINSILEFSSAALAAAQDPDSSETISRDDKDRAMAIHIFRDTGKSKPALDRLPRKFSAEGNLIRVLGEEGCSRNYKNALESIPRNLRTMYVHAYQSLMWNLAASYRWKQWGAQVVEGDLVLVNEHTDKVEKPDYEEVDEEGEAVLRPGSDDRAITANERFERARALSAEDAASGLYSIFDIVIPSPGFDVLYPKYMSEFYKETMGSEQYGKLDPLDMTRKWRDISLSGSYRKILARPFQGSGWSVREYEDENEDLAPTDLQKLQERRRDDQNSTNTETTGKEEIDTTVQEPVHSKEPNVPMDTGTKTTEAVEQAADNDLPTLAPASEDSTEAQVGPSQKPRKRLAVILTFKLGTSQYATMALRELLKHGGATEHKPDYSSGRALT